MSVVKKMTNIESDIGMIHMIKKYLKLELGEYTEILMHSSETQSDLSLFYMSLNPIHDWIVTEFKNDKVYLWMDFLEEEYSSWKDIPKLELNKNNYDNVIKKWNDNLLNLT